MSLNECLIIERILLFVDFHDWPLLQPYRVSTQWSEVFRSESFAQNYLHRLFSLNSAQQRKLRTTIQYFEEGCFTTMDSSSEKKEKASSPKKKEKTLSKKKKEKTSKKKALRENRRLDLMNCFNTCQCVV